MACRTVLVALVAWSSFAAACVRRDTGPVESGGVGDSNGVVAQPTGDPLADALAARNADLASRGYRISGSPVRGQLAAGALTAYPVAAQAGVCYVAFVLAVDPAADFDLYAYDDDGTEVAQHVAPASMSTAWLGFCPPRTGHDTIHVHAYAGGGGYVYALYEGTAPPAGLEQAFAAGAATTPAAGPSAAIDPAIEPRVSRRDAQLGRESFVRVGSPSGATFGNREARRVNATLDTGRCYAFVALSGARDQDVDLMLYSPGGQRVEHDDAHAKDAMVQHCPIVAGQFTLEVLLADGAGPVWLLGYVRGGPAPTMPIASFDAIPTAGPSALPAPVDGARHAVDHELRLRGYEPAGAPLGGTLAEAGVASQEIPLEGGHCYALSAAADLPLTAVELSIHDRAAEMARDATGRSYAVARACPVHAIRVRAEVKAVSGAGAYELRAWKWPGSTQGPFGLSGAIFVRLSEATSILQRDGLEPSTAPTVADARQGQPLRADVDLPAGSCYAIVAAGGPEIRGLDLTLLAGSTALGTTQSREPVAILRRCIETAAHHKIEIRATVGAGQVLHQVFAAASPSTAAPAP